MDNRSAELMEFLKWLSTPVEDDRTPMEQVNDVVEMIIPELDPYEVYTLSELVEMGCPQLWREILTNNLQSSIGGTFFREVKAGKFSPLRYVGKSDKCYTYRVED